MSEVDDSKFGGVDPVSPVTKGRHSTASGVGSGRKASAGGGESSVRYSAEF